jgi:hypothetical protein
VSAVKNDNSTLSNTDDCWLTGTKAPGGTNVVVGTGSKERIFPERQ